MDEKKSKVRFRKLTKEEIANLPPQKGSARSPSRWDDVLDAIAAGETVAIEVSSEKEFRGFRIGLARVAARAERRMKLDFRKGHDGALVVSLSSEPFRSQNAQTPSQRKAPKRSGEENT
jgi:hypothetical protein